MEKALSILTIRLSSLSFFEMARMGNGFNLCHISTRVPRSIKVAIIEKITIMALANESKSSLMLSSVNPSSVIGYVDKFND